MLPSCTVIIPAYNEGNLVYQTLCLSVANSDFQNTITNFAIDDGSKDDDTCTG
jgi:hyaluronan synthase